MYLKMWAFSLVYWIWADWCKGWRKKLNLFLSLPFLFSMIKSTLPFLPVNIIKWSWRWGVLGDFPLILIQSIHLDFSSIAFILLVPLALLEISWRSTLPYLAKKRNKLTLFLSTSLDSEWKPCLKINPNRAGLLDVAWVWGQPSRSTQNTEKTKKKIILFSESL